MRIRKQNQAALIVAALLMLIAMSSCDRDTPVVAPGRPGIGAHRYAVVTGSRDNRPDENPFVSIAREVPSYAGHFIDQNGRLSAYVADSADFAAARAAIQARLSAGALRLPMGVRSADVQILKGDYSFQQLSDWRDDVFEQLLGRVPGLVGDDLDEAHNRVTVKILTGSETAVEQTVLARWA